MDNSTAAVEETRMLKYVLYQSEGAIMLLFNVIIVITVLHHDALRSRKEYIIIGGLALVDCLQGSALLGAGIHRMRKILLGEDNQLWTMWQCLLTYHCFTWLFSDPLAGLMLSVVSIDRFIAMMKPMQYRKKGRKYAMMLVATPYIYMFCSGSVGIYLSFTHSDNPQYRSLCFTSDSLPSGFYSYHKWMQILGAFASVIIYCFVMYFFNKNRSYIIPIGQNNAQQRIMLKNDRILQTKLTKSLGMSALFTVFLYVVPTVLDPLSVRWKETKWITIDQFDKIQVYSNAFSQLNPILNLIIYVTRLQPIRIGVKSVLLCRGQLPQNLGLVAAIGTKSKPPSKMDDKKNERV